MLQIVTNNNKNVYKSNVTDSRNIKSQSGRIRPL